MFLKRSPIFSLGRFYPVRVGNDIGCGMALWQTDILSRKYNADQFEKRLAAVDDLADEVWLDNHLPESLMQRPAQAAWPLPHFECS